MTPFNPILMIKVKLVILVKKNFKKLSAQSDELSSGIFRSGSAQLNENFPNLQFSEIYKIYFVSKILDFFGTSTKITTNLPK